MFCLIIPASDGSDFMFSENDCESWQRNSHFPVYFHKASKILLDLKCMLLFLVIYRSLKNSKPSKCQQFITKYYGIFLRLTPHSSIYRSYNLIGLGLGLMELCMLWSFFPPCNWPGSAKTVLLWKYWWPEYFCNLMKIMDRDSVLLVAFLKWVTAARFWNVMERAIPASEKSLKDCWVDRGSGCTTCRERCQLHGWQYLDNEASFQATRGYLVITKQLIS